MPMSLLLGASETDVVSSCRDVRGVVVKELAAEVCLKGLSSAKDVIDERLNRKVSLSRE